MQCCTRASSLFPLLHPTNSTFPHQYTTMKSRTITPYKSLADLLRLRLQFYHLPQNTSTLRSAVNTVNVLRTRGLLPHAVEATAWLVSAQLSDLNGMEAFLVRCAYAMALVRFVNGMLDPFQQGVHAVALLTIAKSIGLPLSFVDLRHSATHGPLPSLELLRSLTKKALDWLHDHYWDSLLGSISGESEHSVQPQKQPNILITLKLYKKLRKQNLDTPLSGQGKACLDTLVHISNSTQCGTLAEYLVDENFLVRESLKFKTTVRIYSPLFENGLRALLLAVVVGLIHRCSSLSGNAYHGGKLERAQNWAGHLVPILVSADFPIHHTNYGTLDKPGTIQVLRLALGLAPGSPIASTVENAISEKRKKFFLPPLLDEILASPAPTESSKESSNEPNPEPLPLYPPGAKRQKRPVLFYANSEWALSPFGVCP